MDLAFLRHFTSTVAMISLNVAILLSARVRAILVAYGMMLRWEISRIECRHASLRKRSKVSFTWGAAFQQCSASFLLQRSRTEYAWLRKFFPNWPSKCRSQGAAAGGGADMQLSVVTVDAVVDIVVRADVVVDAEEGGVAVEDAGWVLDGRRLRRARRGVKAAIKLEEVGTAHPSISFYLALRM